MDNNKSKQESKTNVDDQAVINSILTQLRHIKRTAYIPITQESNKIFSPHSKFGGFPYLRNSEDWPMCPNCDNHMQLFLQLNLEDIPVNKDKGLIQLFYCTNDDPLCEADCEAFFPFSESTVCRRISIDQISFQIEPVIKELLDGLR